MWPESGTDFITNQHVHDGQDASFGESTLMVHKRGLSRLQLRESQSQTRVPYIPQHLQTKPYFSNIKAHSFHFDPKPIHPSTWSSQQPAAVARTPASVLKRRPAPAEMNQP